MELTMRFDGIKFEARSYSGVVRSPRRDVLRALYNYLTFGCKMVHSSPKTYVASGISKLKERLIGCSN